VADRSGRLLPSGREEEKFKKEKKTNLEYGQKKNGERLVPKLAGKIKKRRDLRTWDHHEKGIKEGSWERANDSEESSSSDLC